MSKRLSYTTAFKLQVVDFAETNGNHSAARCFGVALMKVMLGCGKITFSSMVKTPYRQNS